MNLKELREVLRVIGGMCRVDVGWRRRTAFEMLVAVILSQRTTRENVARALERFRERFRGPREVASASRKEVGEAIKPAGLYRMKAERIREVARWAAEGGLNRVFNLPYPEARRILMRLPGVGLKTADVFLMAVRNEPVLPVDTHIFRVMRRLGVAGERDDYESLRKRLEEAVPPAERMKIHLALIEFGRRVCKPRNPLCGRCPVARLCPAYLSKRPT